MRVKDLDIFVVAPPEGEWGGRYFIFVKLISEDGIVGYGECYGASVGPVAMTAVIEDVFERHIKGRNPEDVEAMFRSAYSAGFTQRPDLTVMGAFSGMEMACWDIVGKARGRPVHALLGGLVNPAVRAYSYIYPYSGQSCDLSTFFNDPQAQADAAAYMVETYGYTALKFDPAGPYTIYDGHQPSLNDLERSAQVCEAIRMAVGSRADLLFGTHGQFTTAGAIRMARRIEPYDPLWFEEPCPPDNLLEFQKVAAQTTVPIATGERLTTMAEFATLLRTGGASILQPALGRVGGLWQARKIAAMAEAFNAQMAPHLYAGPVEWAANIQLCAALPNALIAETISTGDDFHARLIGHTLKVEQGYIAVPEAPGLGIVFDEALARAHPYSGDQLHLEMQAEPYDYRSDQ